MDNQSLIPSQRIAEETAARLAPVLQKFEGSTFLCTGATGLIGRAFVQTLRAYNRTATQPIHLALLVRNPQKAETMFGPSNDELSVFLWEFSNPLPADLPHVDYIVHAGCMTSSSDFLLKPVETVENILASTQSLLAFATQQSARFLYLSTMEIYGETNGVVTESSYGYLDPLNPRNCYPVAKQMAECMVSSYWHEYQLHTVILRLAQTFGAGVPKEDKRVFAEFGRKALNHENIVLLTDGSKRNPYLSVADAVAAIVVLLDQGVAGEAYNAANEATYCSVREMAQMVVDTFSPSSQVLIELDPEKSKQFRNAGDLQLSSAKLSALGWQPQQDLPQMFAAMIEEWQFQEQS